MDETYEETSTEEEPASKKSLPDPTAIVDDETLTELWDSGIVDTQKGRSFLSSLLALPTFTLTEQLHEFLKEHVLTINKSQVLSIGQIYFKAWKAASAERKAVLEETCIQDIIRCSLVTRLQVAAQCLQVLQPFVTQRKLKNVDPMLYTMAEPLIWRSLKAENDEIRYNAISFLLLMFPLDSYEQVPLEHRELLQRQLGILNEYLIDDVPEIRMKTISGVGDIISFYWNIIPPSDLNKLLVTLTQLAWDVSSPGVRATVYKSLRLIMENPATHVALQRLLPKLAMGIHDKNEHVRSAMVDLLLDTRSLKTLKFWKIVPIDHLMNRLANENAPSICERLVKLVFQGYFPAKETEQVRLERTMILFQQNLMAARKFYQYFEKFTSLGLCVEQIMLFLRCVYGHIREAQRGASSTSSGSNRTPLGEDNRINGTEEADQTGETSMAAGDACSNVIDGSTVIAFLDCAAILWNSILPELPKDENKHLREYLYKKGAYLVLKFVKVFDETLILDSVLVLVGLMPKAASRYLVGSLSRKLMATEDGAFDPQLHGNLAEALCNIQLNQIVNNVVTWWRNFDSLIPNAGGGVEGSPPAPKAKRVRISVPEPEDVPKPRLGIQIISYLLSRPVTRNYIINSYLDQLRELELELQGIWEHCLAMVDRCCFDTKSTIEILLLRSSIVALLCSKEGGGAEEAVPFLTSLMDTLRVNVTPVYERLKPQRDESAESLAERAKTILKTSLTIWSDFVMCGLCNEKTILLAVDISKIALTDGLWPETRALIYHILDCIRNNGVTAAVADSLRPWFDQLVALTALEENPFEGMTEVKSMIDKFVQLLADEAPG